MMGKHNPDLQRGLESVFECKHLDWTETKFTEPYQPELAHQEPVMQRIRHAHGFDVRNPSGESRERENTISASTPISKNNLFDESTSAMSDFFQQPKPDDAEFNKYSEQNFSPH